MNPRFRDRFEAGRLLADRLQSYQGRTDVLVLGLARGGVIVAHEIARRLGLPLDALVVRKLGVPCQEEVAMGAIAPDGICVLNDDLVDMLDIEGDAIGAVRRREVQELERREQLYRGDRPPPAVRGRTVLVVDDGIATGATVHAALVYLHQHDAGRIVVAAPVIARDAIRDVQNAHAEVVTLAAADDLRGVGDYYEDFGPVPDATVRRLLATGAAPLGSGSAADAPGQSAQ